MEKHFLTHLGALDSQTTINHPVNILATYDDFEEFKDLPYVPVFVEVNPLSEREDLNLRPLDPQSSALPSCATSRFINYRIIG